MRTLEIKLVGHRYPIYIKNGLLKNTKLLRQHVSGQQVMIVSNKTIAKSYLPDLQTAFKNYQCDYFLLPEGEKAKTLANWSKIFDALLKRQHKRSTTLIALGGGIVGDVTGFAAACYQRGVNFIQIPTSLLAQVDASIGGKTAVNHPSGKNMIGAFYQPQCVIIDTDTLNTLPERELIAGIAEIIKAALISDEDFFNWLEKNIQKLLERKPAALTYAIERACAIKAQIVMQDPLEKTGLRALLNLGHTFGHAIEQNLGYGKWLHGEAVAAGMVLAAETSAQLMGLTIADVTRIKRLLLATKLPISLPNGLKYQKLVNTMRLDKKNTDAGIKLVLLKKLGHAVLADEISVKALQEIMQRFAQ